MRAGGDLTSGAQRSIVVVVTRIALLLPAGSAMAVVVAAVVALVAPASAAAGTVSVTQDEAHLLALRFQANPGEANQLKVTASFDASEGDHPYWVRFVDAGAEIDAAAPGLCAPDGLSVLCGPLSAVRPVEMEIVLSDMADSADMRASCRFFRSTNPDDFFRGPGPCTIVVKGGEGDDSLLGAKRWTCDFDFSSCLSPRAINVLLGRGGDDTLRGGADSDVLRGGLGRDVLSAHKGKDSVKGGRGRDRHYGGKGDDRFRADDGFADWIDGGIGFDRAQIDPELDRTLSVERLD
jgi:hypothetical protein